MSGATLVAFINGSTGGAGAGVYDFTEPSAGVVAIPASATGVTIEVWGAGGGGGGAYLGFIAPGEPEIFAGGGGGGGGYSKTVLSLSGDDGKTINFTVGSGGNGGPYGTNGGGGTFSNVYSGTYSLTTMTANGGGGGTSGESPVQGAGGTAAGGNTTNTTGNGGAVFEQAGAAGVAGDASLTAGAGGDGGFSFEGDPGFSGRVRFVFTF